MGKHYRKEGRGGSRVIRLALLLLLIAALIYVAAGRLPALLSPKNRRTAALPPSAPTGARTRS